MYFVQILSEQSSRLLPFFFLKYSLQGAGKVGEEDQGSQIEDEENKWGQDKKKALEFFFFFLSETSYCFMNATVDLFILFICVCAGSVLLCMAVSS